MNRLPDEKSAVQKDQKAMVKVPPRPLHLSPHRLTPQLFEDFGDNDIRRAIALLRVLRRRCGYPEGIRAGTSRFQLCEAMAAAGLIRFTRVSGRLWAARLPRRAFAESPVEVG